jgi:hypothetical protein
MLMLILLSITLSVFTRTLRRFKTKVKEVTVYHVIEPHYANILLITTTPYPASKAELKIYDYYIQLKEGALPDLGIVAGWLNLIHFDFLNVLKGKIIPLSINQITSFNHISDKRWEINSPLGSKVNLYTSEFVLTVIAVELFYLRFHALQLLKNKINGVGIPAAEFTYYNLANEQVYFLNKMNEFFKLESNEVVVTNVVDFIEFLENSGLKIGDIEEEKANNMFNLSTALQNQIVKEYYDELSIVFTKPGYKIFKKLLNAFKVNTTDSKLLL